MKTTLVGKLNLFAIVRIQEGKTPNDVLQYLISNHVAIHSFQEILPTLNDIFIRLVESSPAARQFQSI